MPKISKILLNLRNFAKSGHTAPFCNLNDVRVSAFFVDNPELYRPYISLPRSPLFSSLSILKQYVCKNSSFRLSFNANYKPTWHHKISKSLWTFHRLILQYQSIFSAHFYLDFDNFNELWRNGLRFHSREGEEELQFPGFERPHEEKYVSMQQNRLSIATSHHRRDNVTFYWGHHNVTSSLRIVIVTSYITLISTFICYVFFVQCQVILLPYRNTLAREQGEKIHTAVSSWIGFVQTRKYFVICMFRHYWIKIM